MLRKEKNLHETLQKQKEVCKEFTDVVKVPSNFDSSESEDSSFPGPIWYRKVRNSTECIKKRKKTLPFKKSKINVSSEPSEYICCDATVCYIPSDSSKNREKVNLNTKIDSNVEITESVTDIIRFIKSKFDELSNIYEENISKTDTNTNSESSHIYNLQEVSKVPRLSSGKGSDEWKSLQDNVLDAKFCCGSRVQSDNYPCGGCERACCSKRIANKNWFWIPEIPTKAEDAPNCDEKVDSGTHNKLECPKAKYKCILKKFQSEMNKIDKIINSVPKIISSEKSITCFELDNSVQNTEKSLKIKSALESSKTKLQNLSKMLDAKSLLKPCDECCSTIPSKSKNKNNHFECTAAKCLGDCRYMLLHSPPTHRPITCNETKSEPQNSTLKDSLDCSCNKSNNKYCKCKKQCKKPKMKYEVPCNSIKKLCYSERPFRQKYGIGNEFSNPCPKIFETVGDLIYAADECKEKYYKDRSKKRQRKRLQVERDRFNKCDRLDLKCIKTCGGKCERECLTNGSI